MTMATAPDPEAWKAVEEFSRQLRHRHRQAGEPSYRRIASQVGISPATVCRYLNGTAMPRWGVVELLLECWGGTEEDIEGLRTQWIRMRNLVDPIDGAGTDAGTEAA
jgi:hypothetical protein